MHVPVTFRSIESRKYTFVQQTWQSTYYMPDVMSVTLRPDHKFAKSEFLVTHHKVLNSLDWYSIIFNIKMVLGNTKAFKKVESLVRGRGSGGAAPGKLNPLRSGGCGDQREWSGREGRAAARRPRANGGSPPVAEQGTEACGFLFSFDAALSRSLSLLEKMWVIVFANPVIIPGHFNRIVC